ncbi:MAG: polysaccharide biosynthesis protein PslF [Acidimicrobiia bacterium]|nr:polysaccharide biosynthesis protein PslF [Acidimicrobiia bacterium]
MRADSPVPSSRPVYAILSTFPPTPCGIATFSRALAGGLATHGIGVEEVRIGDPDAVGPGHSGASSVEQMAEAMNRADVAIVQHEYGLYGGDDGADLLHVLARLTVPTILVAHTVRRSPSPGQKAVLEALADAASAVVVMTEAGQQRLSDHFDLNGAQVVVIPHGAAPAMAAPRQPGATDTTRPTLLTWGLLGPGKGIEWAIDSLALLDDLTPRPRYLVVGDTHPKVAATQGERYRGMLVRRARASGVDGSVTFAPGYQSQESLARLLAEATAVVIPYDSRDQVTSGVLVDAVAAGRPVIATAFPHAVELLSSGAGLVVPQRDPVALADAMRRVLTDPDLAAAMAAEATRLAPTLGWPTIAGQYHALAGRVLLGREMAPA